MLFVDARKFKHAPTCTRTFPRTSHATTTRPRSQTYTKAQRMFTPPNVIAAIFTLIPFLAAAFVGRSLQARTQALHTAVRFLRPIVLCAPYAIVTIAAGDSHWGWLLLYALIPVVLALLMHQAAQADPNQTGDWRDLLVSSPSASPSTVK
jgi:hypothetical protein